MSIGLGGVFVGVTTAANAGVPACRPTWQVWRPAS